MRTSASPNEKDIGRFPAKIEMTGSIPRRAQKSASFAVARTRSSPFRAMDSDSSEIGFTLEILDKMIRNHDAGALISKETLHVEETVTRISSVPTTKNEIKSLLKKKPPSKQAESIDVFDRVSIMIADGVPVSDD